MIFLSIVHWKSVSGSLVQILRNFRESLCLQTQRFGSEDHLNYVLFFYLLQVRFLAVTICEITSGAYSLRDITQRRLCDDGYQRRQQLEKEHDIKVNFTVIISRLGSSVRWKCRNQGGTTKRYLFWHTNFSVCLLLIVLSIQVPDINDCLPIHAPIPANWYVIPDIWYGYTY